MCGCENMSSDSEDLDNTKENDSNQLKVCCIGDLYKGEIFKTIIANDLNKMKELLVSKNYLSAQDNNGHTPLHLAVITNNKEILDLLLQQQDIDINALSYSGDSPLLLSLALRREEDFILKIIESKCNVNTCNATNETALHMAAQCGYTVVGKALIEKGANINARDSSGFTPLHEACCNLHLEFVQLLLNYNADASVKCDSYLTPFMMAVNNTDNPRIPLELLEKEFCLNNITIDGYSTLLLSINSFNPIAFELIERGADINHIAPGGHCTLELALFWENSKLYNAIFSKFYKHLLNTKFLNSLFTKCKFPGEEWGLCTIELLNWDDSLQLFRKYFKQKPNHWTLCSINGIPAKMRVELINRFLSLDIPVTIDAAFEVYNKYGFKEEMEAVLKRNIPYPHQKRTTTLFCPIFYGTVFIHVNLRKLVIKLLCSYENWSIALEAYIKKFINLHQSTVPSLVELSRDACRNFIKKRCRCSGGSLAYHQFLNSLMLPQKIKDIIRLKIPIYS
ncbi:serine/threonine-protein phosphatase 6 regulatory ankyrin repeat subunit B-like [Agrilus planipennis]|uniref:Serine/threonine-protein phosphatase 6 regulatory ankyrin repeat subunit B-like n=1 Tax=Agrilus planipennis TaxID=224129 RepID=A0A1W4XQV2_AGRPL|nr:serine/threonine-protein phosphatase 6 regulatory ankyrin repeat subunit B-like [Agrilus planipennis]